MKWLVCTFVLFSCSSKQGVRPDEDLVKKAANVTIIRDEWGVPHVYGKTDADAVFGALYAQCEDNFEQVERNYIERLGRLSELEGKDYLLQDVQMRLLNDVAAAQAAYQKAPAPLKTLLQAFSDGIHFYLQTHPGVKPALLQRFEPWLPLLFADGAFISTKTGGITATDMRNLYGASLPGVAAIAAPAGSNGFALSGTKTANGHTLLYINPHVHFYFRTELHLVSEEGLNVYGAVTWGQFFVFQGFNQHCGWMHTSTATDVADVYAEQVTTEGGADTYLYDGQQLPVEKQTLLLRYRDGDEQKQTSIPVYRTHHGPVLGRRAAKWLSLKKDHRPLDALIQSWQRTRANSLAEFTSSLNIRANATTNTLYADAAGNIAYWHGNGVPRRPASVNSFEPLDGSTSATEWQGMHSLADLVHYLNPPSGFLQNCNSSPYTAAGRMPSQKRPAYLAPEGENFRSLYALRRLSEGHDWTTASLTRLGYDTYLPMFDTLLPPLMRSLQSFSLSPQLAEAADSLQHWNRRSSSGSVATTVAVFWAYALLAQQRSNTAPDADDVAAVSQLVQQTSGSKMTALLNDVLNGLEQMHGTWKVPWGEINRFQRPAANGDFDDGAPSVASPLASATLGALPSFEAVWKNKRQYGFAGNSFVAVVEFGPRIRAWAVATGGQSSHATSPYFNNQTERFLKGELRPVYFYREEVEQHAKRRYFPGE